MANEELSIINTRIQNKNDTTENWQKIENDFIPLKGESILYDAGTEQQKIKFGDGTTVLGNLPFFGSSNNAIPEIDSLTIDIDTLDYGVYKLVPDITNSTNITIVQNGKQTRIEEHITNLYLFITEIRQSSTSTQKTWFTIVPSTSNSCYIYNGYGLVNGTSAYSDKKRIKEWDSTVTSSDTIFSYYVYLGSNLNVAQLLYPGIYGISATSANISNNWPKDYNGTNRAVLITLNSIVATYTKTGKSNMQILFNTTQAEGQESNDHSLWYRINNIYSASTVYGEWKRFATSEIKNLDITGISSTGTTVTSTGIKLTKNAIINYEDQDLSPKNIVFNDNLPIVAGDNISFTNNGNYIKINSSGSSSTTPGIANIDNLDTTQIRQIDKFDTYYNIWYTTDISGTKTNNTPYRGSIGQHLHLPIKAGAGINIIQQGGSSPFLSIEATGGASQEDSIEWNSSNILVLKNNNTTINTAAPPSAKKRIKSILLKVIPVRYSAGHYYPQNNVGRIYEIPIEILIRFGDSYRINHLINSSSGPPIISFGSPTYLRISPDIGDIQLSTIPNPSFANGNIFYFFSLKCEVLNAGSYDGDYITLGYKLQNTSAVEEGNVY